MSSGISRAVGNMLAFVACQIDILNKQRISPLSGNNSLSETSLDGSYILTIYRDQRNIPLGC